MNLKYYSKPILLLLVVIISMTQAFSQTEEPSEAPKIKIEDAINKVKLYGELIKFKKGFNPVTEKAFTDLFIPDSARIVFDIPIRDTVRKNIEITRISKDENPQSEVISIYGKKMSAGTFCDTLSTICEDLELFSLDNIIELKDINSTGTESNKVSISAVVSYKNEKWLVPKDPSNLIFTVVKKGERLYISDISKKGRFPLNLNINLVNNKNPCRW